MTPATQDKVRELFEIFNSQSASKLADLVADDVTFVDSIQPDAPLKGKQAFRSNMEAWFKAFPDINYTPTTVVTHDDSASVLYVATGTFKAPLTLPDTTLQPTRRRGGYTGCVALTFNPQGKIRRIIDTYDATAWASQYGVTPPS